MGSSCEREVEAAHAYLARTWWAKCVRKLRDQVSNKRDAAGSDGCVWASWRCCRKQSVDDQFWSLALDYCSYPARSLGNPSAAIRPITSEEGLTRTGVCIM